MKEVKSPKKSLLYYYGIVLLIIFLFNILITPMISKNQVVQVEDTQILFTDKEGAVVYRTGPMEDPTLTERLHESGAQFGRVIEEPASPLLTLFMTTILPILIFGGST